MNLPLKQNKETNRLIWTSPIFLMSNVYPRHQSLQFLYHLATWHSLCNLQLHKSTKTWQPVFFQVRVLGVIFVTQSNAIKLHHSFLASANSKGNTLSEQTNFTFFLETTKSSICHTFFGLKLDIDYGGNH